MRYRVGTWILALTLSLAVVPVGACATVEGEEDEVKDAEWHYKMGKGYFENHRIHLAIRELRKALEMDPKMAEAHFILGFIYSGRKKYERSIDHYKKAINLKSNFHSARNNLGSVYLDLNRWKKAAKVFETLLESPTYPTPELAHNNLGWAHYNLDNYSKALKHLEMAVFLKPRMCLAYNNLGLTHQAIGHQSKARKQYRSAIRKCPDNYAEPHFNLAKMLQDRGDMAKAQKHFKRCVELKPETNLGERCRQYLRVRR